MKTFEEIYNIVEESSHETAFNKEECQTLFDLLTNLSDEAVVVEIGVEYGRSTTVIAEVTKWKKFKFTAIDNWCQDNGPEAEQHVRGQMQKHGWEINLVSANSLEFAKKFTDKIDLLHIDGDHTYEGVRDDILAWVPKVKVGGYICFDDYGHDSLPGVYSACMEYLDKYRQTFKFLGRFGNKLGVYQKI